MKTVYIIDDSSKVRTMIRHTIEPAEFQCSEFDSCDRALKRYHEAGVKPDLIIQDVEMPGRSGLSLAEDFIQEKQSITQDTQQILRGLNQNRAQCYIEDTHKRVNILMIAAHATANVCQEYLQLAKQHRDDACLAFLSKPLYRMDLLNKIRSNFFPQCPYLAHQVNIQSIQKEQTKELKSQKTIAELTDVGVKYKHIDPQESKVPQWIQQVIFHQVGKLHIDFDPVCNCEQSIGYILDLAQTCQKIGKAYCLNGLPDAIKDKLGSFAR